MADEPNQALDPSAFVDDEALHQRIARHLGKDSFNAAIKTLESEGFPKKVALFRGRYLPSVLAWLEDKYGVRANADVSIEDGKERFDDAPTRQNTRPQNRPAASAVLDRPPGGAGHHGVSRRLHTVAGGSR
ncbi:MAG: hypothetical protein JWR80_4989 [Bradyrhizobium sp.]|nr:hypothetical protein [Bradyrhizobium sp.]